jgi:hypothetical protein
MPPVVRPLDSFSAFYETRRFITEFTRALHLFLSWATPIQPTSHHPTSPRSIPILSTHLHLSLLSDLFPLAFPPITYIHFFSPPFMLHAPPIHPPRLDYSNYNWRTVQITKLLITHLSPLSHHLIPIGPKYPPQHPVLKQPPSMFLPQCQRPSFTLIQNYGQNYSPVDSNFYVFDSRREYRRFWIEW